SQFPLILAFAVTIHKCQGKSLDNTIIDLSDNVFSTGMANVALSRVITLSGVHLTCFNSKSLMVSSCSIKEIKRLRQLYRPDLPQYANPTDCGSRKCTLTGTIDEPQAKNQKNATTKDQSWVAQPQNLLYPKDVPGDSNCLFNALSHAITCSYIQQNFIRSAIIRHMSTMEHQLRSWLAPNNSVKEYIAGEGMDENYTREGDVTMAVLLNVHIFSHNELGNEWLTLINLNHYCVVISIADKRISNTNNSGDENACDDDKKKKIKRAKRMII
uniref:ATP-dependent DNA helicase n=2 Tax=Amphimedon queenslandica TaxID=400682 RepID=A0A1X7VR91_AMPQE